MIRDLRFGKGILPILYKAQYKPMRVRWLISRVLVQGSSKLLRSRQLVQRYALKKYGLQPTIAVKWTEN